jgi:uncharacterized protein (DUF1501 family)
MDRRRFLELSGGTLFLLQSGIAQGAAASTEGVLVVIFQRGAADGLHMVVPYRDSRYRSLRGALALEEPGKGENATLDLGSGFAFHPALEPLYPMYREGRLAALVNVGSPDPTRSHFDAQDYIESGTPGRKSTRDGWLGRALASRSSSSPFNAVSLTAGVPRSFAGTRDVLALEDFEKLDSPRGSDRTLAARIEELYRSDPNPEFSRAGEEAHRALQRFREKDPLGKKVREGASYPKGRLAPRLRQLAQLVRADLGIRAAFLESEGWDTHFAQGGAEGPMGNSLRELAGSIAAFFEDVGASSPVTLVTVTEFGRTAEANGAGGTDHGHGSVLLAAGSFVTGGRVFGDWLSLDSSNLYEGRDLPVTTDYRDALHEIASASLGIDPSVELFPGYRPKSVGLAAHHSVRSARIASRLEALRAGTSVATSAARVSTSVVERRIGGE